jgi:hypothetical protein
MIVASDGTPLRETSIRAGAYDRSIATVAHLLIDELMPLNIASLDIFSKTQQ